MLIEKIVWFLNIKELLLLYSQPTSTETSAGNNVEHFLTEQATEKSCLLTGSRRCEIAQHRNMQIQFGVLP